MSYGWCFLGISILAYGVANFLQSIAARRLCPHTTGMHPRLLIRLAAQRCYMAGVGCQLVGFLFAFMARKDLPLFLVQTSVAAGLGVTAILGVVLLKWRLPGAEVGLLLTLAGGLTAPILSAEIGPSKTLEPSAVAGIALAVPGIAMLGRLAGRLHGSPGSVALGALAGLSFGATAVASRPLANAESPMEFVTHPLLFVMLAHTVVGQMLLGLAMHRGSTTAAVASMDATAAVPPSVAGLLLLGDRIVPGREWLALLGFVLALGSVLLLTRYAEPQHGKKDTPARRPAALPPAREPVAAAR